MYGPSYNPARMNGNILMRAQPDLVPRSQGRMTHLEIVLQHDIDEHYHYRPGETLSGLVKIYVQNSDVDVTSLKINVAGIGSVGWQSNGSNLISQEIYITEAITLAPLDDSVALYLAIGVHDFNFKYTLPSRLPSSFIGKYGSITYVLKATALDSKKTPMICSEPFLVANRLFPWTTQEMLAPQESNVEKRYKGGFCQSGKVKLSVVLPRSGFYPGDDIKLNVQVVNRSPRTVLGIAADLMMHTSFTAQSNVHTHIQNLAKRHDRWELVRGEGRRWNNAYLSVPMYTPESNLEGCDIIDIRFELVLKVEVKKKNALDEDLRLVMPIIIGPISDVMDPSRERNRKKAARTIDRKTLESMDIEKLLALQQGDDEFQYEAPVNDGTLRVNPLYNKTIQTESESLHEDDYGSGSELSINTKL